MKSTKEQLQRRGFVSKDEWCHFANNSEDLLLEWIQSGCAKERSIAVRILSQQNKMQPEKLVEMLTSESALYTKIEIQKALIKHGHTAIPYLVEKLGIIGKNQYQTICNKDLGKKTFPIARDIAARILCGIGPSAIPALNDVLINGEISKKLEAMDAIGYIAYHYDCYDSESLLLDLLEKNSDVLLLRWKIVRALQGFATINALNELFKQRENETEPILVAEIERSLFVIQKKMDKKARFL